MNLFTMQPTEISFNFVRYRLWEHDPVQLLISLTRILGTKTAYTYWLLDYTKVRLDESMVRDCQKTLTLAVYNFAFCFPSAPYSLPFWKKSLL